MTDKLENSYVERRFDYTGGRKDASELIIMVGIGGSGKSTVSKSFVNKDRGQTVRLNRDDFRKMLYDQVPWSSKLEDLTRSVQREAARIALQMGKNVVIDDTNCNRNVRAKWEEFAQQCKVKFRIVTMNTTLAECITRDSKRLGKEKLGQEIIERQHKDLNSVSVRPHDEPRITLSRPYLKRMELLQGSLPLHLPGRPIVIVDVDGTVANNVKNRSPYDESRVIEDEPHETIATWVRNLYSSYNICIVSGRHDTCGDETWDWFEMNDIPFDGMFMRYAADNRSDTIIKKEILDELRSVVGENIAFALDDRPRIIRMWRENGILALPVRGWVIHTNGCPYTNEKKYGTCPKCGAIEDF